MTEAKPQSATLTRLWQSDLAYSFRRSPVIVASAIFILIAVIVSFGAPLLAPHDTLDPSKLDLLNASLPPFWEDGGDPTYLLGTDTAGRDILSAIFYGTRISLIIGLCAVAFSMVLGVALGLISGYIGGFVDTLIMRIADIQLSVPAILIAFLVAGVAHLMLPTDAQSSVGIAVLILAIGLSGWVQFARTVRGSTMVERNKEYVQAARIIGRNAGSIMLEHILPNVMGSVLVIATISLSVAIITEATLSFLGVGLSPTEPSLGTLIRVGNNYLFSGEWWITVFPAAALTVLVVSVNLLGDWLRDALNPKLR